MNIYLAPFILWPLSFFVATAIHEVGHVAMFRLFTRRGTWHIYLGSGRPIVKTNRLTIGAYFYMSGKATWSTEASLGRISRAFILAGGALLNLAFVVLVQVLFSVLPQQLTEHTGLVFVGRLAYLMRYVLVANLLLVAITLFPHHHRFGVYQGPSDGLQIFKLLKDRG